MNRFGKLALVASILSFLGCGDGAPDDGGEDVDKAEGELGSVMVFTPTEDAAIASDRPGTSFGSSPTLAADASPERRSLLRFEVKGIPWNATVLSARVELYSVDTIVESGELHHAAFDWSEDTVTWFRKPADLGRVTAVRDGQSLSGWRVANVTKDVTGNGTYEYYLVTSSTDRINYASSETAHPPRLRVRYTVGGDAGMPDAGGFRACSFDAECGFGEACIFGVCQSTTRDGGYQFDAGYTFDGGYSRDAGYTFDAGYSRDAGYTFDAGYSRDAGYTFDAGFRVDAGNLWDAGSNRDAGP